VTLHVALAIVIHTSGKLEFSAMLVQSQKAEIFQAGKRSIQNQKMTDYWGQS